jgi:hypothetical protein
MDWRELADLAAAGHEIGSHSMTHELLPQLDDNGLRYEVAQSREVIEKQIARPVQAFCYPNGEADDRVVRAVRAAGYCCAVTVQRGVNEHTCDDHRLRRWFIHENRLADPDGRPSAMLFRMEMCCLADCVFGRGGRRTRSS